ncbi:hypothetical protein CJ030_MR1G011764 [Morella rubra]|uniref:Uncharacterized protein n=1 Tax=Morella rubra TaxID=262757 RepID=A0A6A1WNH9_9ROSI|nr:hypothetical protein CJ030_MR1G011764 [Morella rubra]
MESSFIVFYVKAYIKCLELSAHATRSGIGSSSQEQEVVDPMMTLERQMEYPRGRPVAKECPVMLFDFDQLLYEEHSLYQLFEYQDFFISSRGLRDFPETPCFPTVPLTDEQRTSELGLVDADDWEDLCSGGQHNQAETHSIECSFTRAQCMLLLGQQTQIDFPFYMFELIMDDAWGIKDNSLQYGVFLTKFLIQRGVVNGEGETHKKTALQPLQEQVDKLSKDVQELQDDQEKLQTAFEGQCTIAYLRNKAVVAHMTEVNEQLEEIKKTLDDFKTKADPQKIPGDIPDDMETFRDAVQP